MADALFVVCPRCDKINRVPRERLREPSQCGVCHGRLFEGRPVALDETARFDRHAQKGDVPLLVDFWATWCGPCRTMAPIFEQAAGVLEPELRLVKVDTDKAPELAQRFGIQSIPTLVIVRKGDEVARQAGTMSSSQLVAWARQHARETGL